MKANSGGVRALLLLASCVVLALLLLVNRQAIVDRMAVLQFQPSQSITSLVDRSGMNDLGKFYFYASRPELNTRTAFNAACANQDKGTAVLGCYADQRIYVYDVTDQRLDGIKSVTAAHEMLHAAYDRLSDAERRDVDAMLECQYGALKSNADLEKRMAVYAKTEPGQRDNELHSLLGTEIETLSPELERYYERYFDDRSKTVTLHGTYQSVFNDLEQKAAAINVQMDQLKRDIEFGTASYTTNIAALNATIAEFNRRADNGSFSSEAAFDSQRAGILNLVNTLNDARATINTNIDHYNELNKQLAEIASQTTNLNQSINSSLPAAPSL